MTWRRHSGNIGFTRCVPPPSSPCCRVAAGGGRSACALQGRGVDQPDLVPYHCPIAHPSVHRVQCYCRVCILCNGRSARPNAASADAASRHGDDCRAQDSMYVGVVRMCEHRLRRGGGLPAFEQPPCIAIPQSPTGWGPFALHCRTSHDGVVECCEAVLHNSPPQSRTPFSSLQLALHRHS